MKEEKLIEMINLYFDDRLSKAEEVFLFTRLAEEEEMRELFKKHNTIRTAVEIAAEDFPEELEEKILDSVLEKSKRNELNVRANTSFLNRQFILYITAAILLLLSFLFYNNSLKYRHQLETTTMQVNHQSKMIELLMNSLPTATVKTSLQNEIVIEPKS